MNVSITIIGYGRLGKLLKKTFTKAGYDQISVIRKEDELLFLNEFIFIAVPDRNIASVLEQIRDSGLHLDGKTISHCSGVLGLDVFSKLEKNEIQVGCMHPLVAITEHTNSFEGLTFDVCGDERYLEKVKPIVSDLGANFMEVNEHEKAKIHLSAVITSNYLITLMGMVERLFEEEELDQKELKKAFLPLMDSALKNLEHQSPSKALTGPIVRGDVESIAHHLELLEAHADLKSTYVQLGVETLQMLGNDLEKEVREDFKILFDEA